MNNSVENFYGNNGKILENITGLDSTVDFGGNIEFISKNGIQKDANIDAIEILVA